jgi:CspA family cold shock protein
MTGKVKWFNPNKQFGFIATDKGDVFIHASDVPEGVELKENTPVVFDLAETPKGQKAVNLTVGGVL